MNSTGLVALHLLYTDEATAAPVSSPIKWRLAGAPLTSDIKQVPGHHFFLKEYSQIKIIFLDRLKSLNKKKDNFVKLLIFLHS